MRVLIHICCGPCLAGPLGALRREGMDLAGYFYNPNIHPLIEFRRRVKALRVFLESDPLPVEIDDAYGLEAFLRGVDPLAPGRCERCYAMRLDRAASVAAEKGFDAFTTTLLVSKHQEHDLVRRVGERVASRHPVAFLYRDLRPLADACGQEAKSRQLYRQTYCGCVFSEADRYRDTTLHLYRGPGGAGARAP